MVGVLSLHSTDKAGPETWDIKRADGERAGYSRDRAGKNINTYKMTTTKGESNMSNKNFNPIPLVNPRSIRFYNQEDGLTEQTITKNVEMFIDDINTGKFDASSHFSWYEKPVPLAVKYLLWKGISVMTPS